MTDEKPDIREAVGALHTAEAVEAAVEDLERHGFDRAQISLLASDAAIEEKLGRHYSRIADLEDNDETPRSAFVSTVSVREAQGALVGSLLYVGAVAAMGAVVASGGAAAAAAGAALAGGGAGGMIGGVLASFVGETHAQRLQDQIDAGGILLWVRTWDAVDEEKAAAILKKHGATEVHVHSFRANA